MLRPDTIRETTIHYNNNESTLSTAENAAIDSVYSSHDVYPYAFTATVSDNFDETDMYMHNSNLVTGMKIAWGVFLSAENTKRNPLFQCNGSIIFKEGGGSILCYPVFGRTNASSVTSSKAAPSNLLAKYKILPYTKTYSNNNVVTCSVSRQVLGYYLSTGYIWFFGWVLENLAGADQALYLRSSLDFAKFTAPFDTYNPDRL